jgi:hypothetical protein
MAGFPGNQAWLMAQKQTAKGTAAVPSLTAAYKNPFTGGNISPTRETDQLSETDSSRDRGVTYVTSGGVEGTPEFYVRDSSIGFWLFAALGVDAPTGTTNFVHAITPGSVLPYITCWRDIADQLYEEYRDCKVGTLTISAEAGSPLTASAAIQGLQATRLTAAPDAATPVPIQSSTVYNFNGATITLGGSATSTVRSFELTIENNLTRQQTDDVVPYDVVEGTREVSLSFDMIFDSLVEYNKFYYGGATGTAVSSAVYTTAATFTFDLPTVSANNSIAFNLPSIAYTEFPVEPSAAGDPIVVSVAAAAQRGGSPVVTATVKNQVASY